MSDNVVTFTGETKLDLPAKQVLQAAIKEEIEDAIIVGHKDGKLYLASGPADVAMVYLMLSCALKEVMAAAYD